MTLSLLDIAYYEKNIIRNISLVSNAIIAIIYAFNSVFRERQQGKS